MIDPTVERLITLADAAELIPRRRAGKKCDVSCLYRWTSRGLRGVRLDYLQCGGKRATSAAALGRFYEELTAKAGAASGSRSAQASRRAAELAGEELKSRGL
jgi:hypothetical protein